jgi:hypothetical protein
MTMPRCLSKTKLIATWTNGRGNYGEPDVIYSWPKADNWPDGRLLHSVFSPTTGGGLLEELEKRGYDITTFRFEIKLKPKPKVKKPEPVLDFAI